jgi:molybdenum cofactor cytidylyltransferase
VKPALVVLAAGSSARLGECKALVPITPLSPLEWLLESGASLDDTAPLVVTGADHERIQARVPRGVAIGHNPRWELGRTGGIQLAHALRRGLDLCLAPVDVPLVSREVFHALSRAWHDAGSPARGWLAPKHALRFGHPIVIGRGLLEELAEFGPDEPLQRLRERAAPLFFASVPCPEVLEDLDTPLDLNRMRARF